MTAVSPEQELVFQRFIAAGNEVVGRPERVLGIFRIAEFGSGSLIEFGKGVTLVGGTMHFPLGGGALLLGDDVKFRSRTHAGPKSVVSVGRKTLFNRDCELHAWEGASIEIGEGCLFSNAKVRTSDLHSIYSLSTKERVNRSRSVRIGDRVWIAEGAVIGKGSNIDDGSVIGSHSFVTGYIPKNTIAVGAPAKVVKRDVYWERPLDMSDPIALPYAAPSPDHS